MGWGMAGRVTAAGAGKDGRAGSGDSAVRSAERVRSKNVGALVQYARRKVKSGKTRFVGRPLLSRLRRRFAFCAFAPLRGTQRGHPARRLKPRRFLFCPSASPARGATRPVRAVRAQPFRKHGKKMPTYLCGYEVAGIALSGMRPRRRMQPTPMPRVVFWGATALKKGSSGTTASPARLSLASGALP